MEAGIVTASGLVYLFSSEFAGSRFLGSFERTLAERLFEAAFVFLEGQGYISLEVKERKWLFFMWDVLTITSKRRGDDLPASLEREIMDCSWWSVTAEAGFGGGSCIASSPTDERVKTVVMSVIGPKRDDPWKWVVGFVRQQLVEEGILTYPRYRSESRILGRYWSEDAALPVPADEEGVAALASKAQILKKSLEALDRQKSDLHRKLVGEVSAGLNDREICDY